ncbi:MAG TPA: S-layer homology domain-containing protein [Thermoanaerobacterales bacterium]|nr:S-layer homology domain-containing protein [Thermoanaerobacterales bacterium]
MKHKKSLAPGIMLMLIIIIFFSTFWGAAVSLATNPDPDVTLDVSGNGSTAGPMFTGGLWAPGMSQTGTLRLNNNHTERVRVNSLGLSMELLNDRAEIIAPGETLYEAFAKNMKLTIKRGRLLVFSHTVFDGSFFDLLYRIGDETYRGYALPETAKFNINENGSVDLEYTVHMDEESGNDMQGLKATVAFLVNMDENPVPEHKNRNKNNELVEEPLEEYPDIGGHWAHDCIAALLQHGIIHGYPDGTIRPDNYITRAEAAVLVANALKLGEKEGTLPYVDPIPEWAQGYILSATEKDVFEGYPGNVFKPENYITREEMAAVLIRAFDKKAIDGTELLFKDTDDIAKWAVEYVKAGVDNSIITGYPDNTFKPENKVTRAEAFTMICKLLGYHSEHSK